MDSYHYASLPFPSGAVLRIADGQIVGREEPKPAQPAPPASPGAYPANANLLKTA